MGILDDIFGIGVGSPSDRVITPGVGEKTDRFDPFARKRKLPMPTVPGKFYKGQRPYGLGLEDPNHPALRAPGGGRAPTGTVKLPRVAPGIAGLTDAEMAQAHGFGGWNTEVAPVVPKAAAKPKAPPQSFLSKALGFDDKSGKSSYLTELGLRMASRKDKKGPLSFLTDPLLETYESQSKKEAAAAKFGLEKQRTEADVLSANTAMQVARLNARKYGQEAAAKRKNNAIKQAINIVFPGEGTDMSSIMSDPKNAAKVLEVARGIYGADLSVDPFEGVGPNPIAGLTAND